MSACVVVCVAFDIRKMDRSITAILHMLTESWAAGTSAFTVFAVVWPVFDRFPYRSWGSGLCPASSTNDHWTENKVVPHSN